MEFYINGKIGGVIFTSYVNGVPIHITIVDVVRILDVPSSG